VYTKDGPKIIAEIAPNDELVTKDGRLDRVVEVIHSSHKGDVIEIETQGSLKPFKVTPDHPLLVLRGQTKNSVNFSLIRDRLEKGRLEPQFVEAKYLNDNDLVAYPIPTYELDVPEYSNEDCRFFGIMIGDGHISRNNKQAHVTLHSSEKKETYGFVKAYLEANLIHTTETIRSDNYLRLTWQIPHWFKITRQMIYDDNADKIISRHLLHLPREKAQHFVKGLMETDGCIGTKEVTLEMSSWNVIEGMRYILLRLGVLTSGYYRNRVGETHELPSNRGSITTQKPSFVLRIPQTETISNLLGCRQAQYVKFLRYGNTIYSRIKNATLTSYNGETVDLRMESTWNRGTQTLRRLSS
jgi:ribonucleoside-diphosphate reductase alpha chain